MTMNVSLQNKDLTPGLGELFNTNLEVAQNIVLEVSIERIGLIVNGVVESLIVDKEDVHYHYNQLVKLLYLPDGLAVLALKLTMLPHELPVLNLTIHPKKETK